MYQSMRWNISRGDVPPAVDGGAERLATAPRLNDFFVFCDFTSHVPVWSAHLTHAFYEGTDLPATYDMVGRDHLEFTLPLKTLWAKHFGADSRAGSPAGKVMMAIMRGKDAYQVFNVSLVMRDKDTGRCHTHGHRQRHLREGDGRGARVWTISSRISWARGANSAVG